jgi:hypothetical protein
VITMTAPAPTDITRRLYAEFHDHYALGQIAAAVHAAEHDLAGSPPAALPELIERLTRQRLTDQPTTGRP